MINKLYVRMQEELERQTQICFRQSLDPQNSNNPDQQLDAVLSINLLYLQDDYKNARNLLSNPDEAQKYLHAKRLKTYGDLLDMHDRIISYTTETDPKRVHKVLKKIAEGGKEPEFQGSGRIHLNVFDFLVAIPNIPHSADPEQPTTLGLLLSAGQSVLRDKRFIDCPFSHHDFMHLLLVHGVFASGFAHTTAGKSIPDAYIKHWPSENSHFRKDTFLFDDFTIKNAIPFRPEAVLLTGYPRTRLAEGESSAPWQMVYDVFNSGQAFFVLPPDNEHHMQNSISPSSGFTPDFMRVMHSLIRSS